MATTMAYYTNTTDDVTAVTNATACRTQQGLKNPYFTIPFLAMCALICIVGLCGHTLVIYVTLKYDKLKTIITSHYILNLSITDSLYLLTMPAIIATGISSRWLFGNMFCKLFNAVYCINMFTSAFTITVMAVDRYFAACHPFTAIHYRKTRYAQLMILLTWILAFVAMTPAIYHAGLDKCNRCDIHWSTNPVLQHRAQRFFAGYTLALAFVLPVIIICTSYLKIILRLRRGTMSDTATAAAQSDRRQVQYRKASRLVTMVICVFIVCWLPHWICQIMLVTQALGGYLVLYQAATLLMYLNSMLNPLLYGFTNEHFRNAFNSAFTCQAVLAQPAVEHTTRGNHTHLVSARHTNHHHDDAGGAGCGADDDGGGGGGSKKEVAELPNHHAEEMELINQ